MRTVYEKVHEMVAKSAYGTAEKMVVLLVDWMVPSMDKCSVDVKVKMLVDEMVGR